MRMMRLDVEALCSYNLKILWWHGVKLKVILPPMVALDLREGLISLLPLDHKPDSVDGLCRYWRVIQIFTVDGLPDWYNPSNHR